jgi:hypothetical protein
MYKLIFKGTGIDPMFLDDEKGKVILESYLSNKSIRIMAAGQAFSTSDVKAIFKVERSNSEMAKPATSQENEYLEFRKKMLNLTIEKRAEILRIPKMIWQSISGEDMTEEVKQEIKKRQLAYFKENPNCIYANPKIYRDIMPLAREDNFKRDQMKKIKGLIAPSLMRFIENAIQTDLQYSKI